jgi:hypothetical protein
MRKDRVKVPITEGFTASPRLRLFVVDDRIGERLPYASRPIITCVIVIPSAEIVMALGF